MGGVGVGGMGGRILYYYLAGRASEIERLEYLVARKEKSDMVDSWIEFSEQMEHGRANRVLHWWKHSW
jgi:hypothetical protein